QRDGCQMEISLDATQLLIESSTEDDNQLELKESLDAGQHHAAFVQKIFGGFRERKTWFLAVCGVNFMRHRQLLGITNIMGVRFGLMSRARSRENIDVRVSADGRQRVIEQ